MSFDETTPIANAKLRQAETDAIERRRTWSIAGLMGDAIRITPWQIMRGASFCVILGISFQQIWQIVRDFNARLDRLEYVARKIDHNEHAIAQRLGIVLTEDEPEKAADDDHSFPYIAKGTP